MTEIPEPKQVWLIESGSYSDYGVIAVCPDEDTARSICATLNGHGRTSYDPWEYSPRPLLTKPPQHVTCWVAHDDGRIIPTTYLDFQAPEDGAQAHRATWHRSEDAARKALQDRAARQSAINAGLDHL